MRQIEPQPKGTAPDPLYRITYQKKVLRGFSPVEKIIHFQTEKQYLSWLKRSYATAQDQYDVTVEKRNDFKRKPGVMYIYPRYIKVYPND